MPFKKVLLPVDFETSLSAGTPADYISFRHENATKFFKLYAKLYSENFNASTIEQPKIPKIIHQFWIGGQPPPLYLQYQQTCKNLHKEWKFILWNDDNIGELDYDQEIIKGFGH